MGTPMYMSPEQVKADKSIDHRSDIYSLGVTMFYAINGKPPYNSDTDSQFDIFNKIVFEPLPELPETGYLNELIKKACIKDRSVRFQYCREMMGVLKNKEKTKIQTTENTVIDGSTTKKTILESSSTPNTDKTNPKPKAANSVVQAYFLQFLFGFGFNYLKINRTRSYLYIILILYGWFSFLNIFLCDFGRGPFGGIPILLDLSEFHNKTDIGASSIFLSWFIGHIIGLFDLLITQRRIAVTFIK